MLIELQKSQSDIDLSFRSISPLILCNTYKIKLCIQILDMTAFGVRMKPSVVLACEPNQIDLG